MKQIRYVYGVNPITGEPCTTRIVVTAEDVTLWQVDQRIETEAEFDAIDSENLGMVCLPHVAFKEVLEAYLVYPGTAVRAGTTTLEAKDKKKAECNECDHFKEWVNDKDDFIVCHKHGSVENTDAECCKDFKYFDEEAEE